MIDSIFFTSDAAKVLPSLLKPYAGECILVVMDEHTEQLCWPALQELDCFRQAHTVIIGCGEENKSIDTLCHVWQRLVDAGATRRSVVVCVGGGMVCDLGGMAAATFKRGLDCINVPTTLLAMVDASVGGKTAVNFAGLKNEVGVFAQPKAVVVSTEFLSTLPARQVLSGYGEMVKHALLADTLLWGDTLRFEPLQTDNDTLSQLIQRSVEVKSRYVEADPSEHSERKALNLGHTFGHAFESFFMEKGQPVTHGHAVAAGLVCCLYLSAVLHGFNTTQMRQTVSFLHEHYARLNFTCHDYEQLFRLMLHDKKNTADGIHFTLLKSIGEPIIDQRVDQKLIFEALDFYREG